MRECARHCGHPRAAGDCYCAPCRNEINRAWRAAHPEKMKAARDRWRTHNRKEAPHANPLAR
jgi:hypothetical protein